MTNSACLKWVKGLDTLLKVLFGIAKIAKNQVKHLQIQHGCVAYLLILNLQEKRYVSLTFCCHCAFGQ